MCGEGEELLWGHAHALEDRLEPGLGLAGGIGAEQVAGFGGAPHEVAGEAGQAVVADLF